MATMILEKDCRFCNCEFEPALLHGMKHILARLQRAGRIAPGWTVDMAAETARSLVHPASWRLLVVECGWSADQFRRTRIEIIRGTLGSDPE